MLNVHTLTVGQMDENCYLVWDSNTLETIIIDPGDDSEYISQKILDLELKPLSIIATHAHFDHIGAVLPLMLAFSIPFVMNKKDNILLKHYRQSSIHFTQIDPGPAPKPTKFIKEGELIHIGKETLEVIERPGHTPGTINLYSQKNNILFVGDNLFNEGGIGRTDFSYCDKTNLIDSVLKTLKLPENTLAFAGHGDSFLISEVKGYFLES